MQKKHAISLVLLILFISLACVTSYTSKDPNFHFNEYDDDQYAHLLSRLTEESPSSGVDEPPLAEPTIVPPPTAVAEPISVSETNTTTEFSVTAQNFDCICKTDGTETQEFRIEGDQVYIDGKVYDKTSNNTYRHEWMGYYILVSGEGENRTETKVEEIHATIIVLTETGYIMENYKGDVGSPCCIFTFTRKD